MITTLNILAELVIRPLVGGDEPSDSPYNKAFVIEELRMALNEDLKLERLKRRAQDDDRSNIAQMIATYEDVVVQIQKTTARAYIDLPTNFLSLERNKGIVSVSAMDKPLNAFIRVDHPSVTSRLPHSHFENIGTQGYYVEGLRIYFMRDIKKEKIDKILLKLLVAAPDTIRPDDALPVLPENVGRILDLVRQRVSNKAPQDRIADNNPNLRQTNESRK